MNYTEVYVRVNDANVVTEIHYNPFDPSEGLATPRDELEKDGYFVQSVPKAEIRSGRRAVPMYNPDTKEVYYKYVPVAKTTTERLTEIEGLLNEMLMSGVTIGGDK